MPTVTAIAVTPGAPTSLRRISIDIPAPTGSEVLIDVIRCGICGTDREVIAGHIGGPPSEAADIVLGHEMLGRVHAIGPGVTSFSPGDLVTATVRRPDGCPLCAAGQPDMCVQGDYTEHGIKGLHGFLAEQVLVDEQWVVTLPDRLEATGTLVEPLSVIEKVLRQAHCIQQRLAIWEPRTAVVLGAGPVGILATMVLRARGFDVATVARTPGPNAASTAVERTGARYVSTEEESLSWLKGADFVLEATGASAMSFEAVGLVGKNGIVSLLSPAGAGGTIELSVDLLNLSLVPTNAMVLGSVNAGREDWDAAVADLDRFEELWPGLARSLITTRIPFDGDVTPIATGGAGGIKTVVEFGRH